jgi:hypothetical protein
MVGVDNNGIQEQKLQTTFGTWEDSSQTDSRPPKLETATAKVSGSSGHQQF